MDGYSGDLNVHNATLAEELYVFFMLTKRLTASTIVGVHFSYNIFTCGAEVSSSSYWLSVA